MLLFYLFLSQIWTDLGDLGLILKGKIRRKKSLVRFSRDRFKPIKTDCDHFFKSSPVFWVFTIKGNRLRLQLRQKKGKKSDQTGLLNTSNHCQCYWSSSSSIKKVQTPLTQTHKPSSQVRVCWQVIKFPPHPHKPAQVSKPVFTTIHAYSHVHE